MDNFGLGSAAMKSHVAEASYALNTPQQASPTQQLTNSLRRADRLMDDINMQLSRLREGDQPQPSGTSSTGLGEIAMPQRGLPDLAISTEILANRLEDILSQLRSF